MKTNLSEWSTWYQCFIRPKVHFVHFEFSFELYLCLLCLFISINMLISFQLLVYLTLKKLSSIENIEKADLFLTFDGG